MTPLVETPRVTFAAGGGALDRAAHLRDTSGELLRRPGAAVWPLWQEKVLVNLGQGGPRPGWMQPLDDYLAEAADHPVFLGISGGNPCFAADFSRLDADAAAERFGAAGKFIDLRSIAGELDPGSAAIAATAKGLLGWHRTHRFCSRCGAASEMENGGWRRRCPSCAGLHFPRTDPVVIMLVVRGDRVLLGRQSTFPPGIYSLLAGFMEPGETIEDAVRREVKEETTVEVGRVAYLGCQPWPFPSNLMLGCVGEAGTEAITIDPAELEDAVWVSRARMQSILDGGDPGINAPRRDAIARAILIDWVHGRVPGF